MTARSNKPLILLAAGGTGGHVFPAEALAAELLRRKNCRLAFVTDKRGKGYSGVLGKLDTYPIRAGGIAGKSPLKLMQGVMNIAAGLLQSRRLIRKLKPAAAVGFGGYAAFSPLMAATQLGVPSVIHEQNAVLGRANRLLAARVRKIAASYPDTHLLGKGLAPRVVYTGMPVRPQVLKARKTAYKAPTAKGTFNLVVLGGSQGATVLSHVVPAALARLPKAQRRRLRVSQQCRKEDLEQVARTYEEAGIKATLKSFFNDVPKRLQSAHLVLTRSGSSSVAEMTAMGRPAIYIPYPHATDDHQAHNARFVQDAGGGWAMKQEAFTTTLLANRLETLMSDPGTLKKAAAAARAIGVPDAAERLADLIMELVDQINQKREAVS